MSPLMLISGFMFIAGFAGGFATRACLSLQRRARARRRRYSAIGTLPDVGPSARSTAA
jgi:hypothetical protein